MGTDTIGNKKQKLAMNIVNQLMDLVAEKWVKDDMQSHFAGWRQKHNDGMDALVRSVFCELEDEQASRFSVDALVRCFENAIIRMKNDYYDHSKDGEEYEADKIGGWINTLEKVKDYFENQNT